MSKTFFEKFLYLGKKLSATLFTMVIERGAIDLDKQLTSFERRLEILFILMRNKKCSMTELAFQYSVSDRTIRRDILFLSRYAPICTKTGLNGGAFLMDGYRKELMLHLSREEEALLLKIMRTLDEKEQHLIYNIINKYAMPKSST